MQSLFIIALFKTLSKPLGIYYKVKHNLKIFLNIYLAENLVALPRQNKIQVFSENPCLLSIRIIRKAKTNLILKRLGYKMYTNSGADL